MKTFSDLGISEVFFKALKENKIETPTEIQQKTIPFLLKEGKDIVAQAQTGTGKTAAYGLPLLQKVDPSRAQIQALILCPTRELGQQIQKQLFRFTKYGPKVFTEAVYGGAPIGDQIKALTRPTQILVATPGRLVDLHEKKAVDLSHVRTVVLDEADEMLSMGFKKELNQILNLISGKRNIWLFSATMPEEIKNIINSYMSADAFKISVGEKNVINRNIEHWYMECEENQKLEVLIRFLKEQGENRGMIFCRTKSAADILGKQLKAKNFAVDALHGDMQQKDRDKVMRAFKGGKLQMLVATDLAARGIDVENLAYVAHYQLPDQVDYYTHRSGRTARAGKTGISLCLITDKEFRNLKKIETDLGISIKPVPVKIR